MLKNILIYTSTFTALFLIGYYVHDSIIENQQIKLIFSLQKVYIFHALFSLIICIVFTVISSKDKVFQQLGFIYLGTLVLKIVVFCIVFYNPILTTENISKINSLSLLIPIAIFLITEVYFIAKILNRK